MNLRYSFFQEKKICKNIVPKVDKTTLNWLIPRRVAKGVLFLKPKMNKKKDSAKCIFLVLDLEKMGLYILNLKYKIQEKRTSKSMFLSH